MTHKILMFHGKEGSPYGRKATYLRENPVYTAHIPSYPSNQGPVEDVFDTCYEIAKKELAKMARAGFSFDISKKILGMSDHEIEEIIMNY